MKYLVVQAFWYFDQVTGEFIYRIKSPGESLQTHPSFEVINMHVFHPLFPQLAMSADVLILHLIPDEEIFRIIYNRRRMGKPTVFEIADNFLSLGDWVGPDDAMRNPEIRQNFMYFAALCDGVQFSTTEVANTFGFLNKNQAVLENQSTHFSQSRPQERPFVIGWGGSKGHEQDLAAIAPVIIEFCRRHRDVIFHFMGYPPIFHRHFGKLSDKQKRCTEAGPIENYFAFLGEIHVGLAPLSDTEFNRCRSDVKFLEYASHSVVPVLADVTPYRVHARHGENALLFKNPQELNLILEDLYQNPDKLSQLSKSAYRYAKIKRNQASHLGRRVVFLEKLLKHEAFVQKVPPLPDCSGLITYLRRATHEYSLNQHVEAADILEKVLRLHPGFQLAHVWKAKNLIALGRFQEVLQAYAAFKVDQVYFDLFLECLIVAAQQLGNPLWRELHKLVVNPVLKINLDLDLTSSAEDRLREILQHNPYHFRSLVDLGSLLLQRGDAQCLTWLKQARFMAPESVEVQQLYQQALALAN